MTDVIMIGCGAPNISMGHTHLDQLLHEPSLCARVSIFGVVEPFYLDPAHADAAKASGFAGFAAGLARERPSVHFVRSVSELPARARERPCLVILAPRTQDVPRLFRELMAAQPALGVTHMLVEKPGGPDVVSIAAMQAEAAAAGIQVFVGYNKNVANFTQRSVAALASLHHAGASVAVELHHDNDYSVEALPECFERCRAGMLKDMAVHELAIAVCLFGLRAAALPSATITLDRARSRLETHGGITDWRALAVTIRLPPSPDDDGPPDGPTAAVREISLIADRCGGGTSHIVVRALEPAPAAVDAGNRGHGRFEFEMPSAEEQESIARRQAQRRQLRTYLCTQWADYVALKARILSHIELPAALAAALPAPLADGEVAAAAPWPAGVASLQDALEILQVAEFLEPLCRAQWAASGEQAI